MCQEAFLYVCVCVSVHLWAYAEAVMDPVKVSPQKSLSTASACWDNVFDLAAQQQQVLGGPSWSYCSPPALICRPRTGLPFPVPFLPISFLSSFFCIIVHFSPIASVFLTYLIATISFMCLVFLARCSVTFLLWPFSFLTFLFPIFQVFLLQRSFFFYSLFVFLRPLTFSSPCIQHVKELSCPPATHLLDLNDTTRCKAVSPSLNLHSMDHWKRGIKGLEVVKKEIVIIHYAGCSLRINKWIVGVQICCLRNWLTIWEIHLFAFLQRVRWGKQYHSPKR